VSVSSSLQARQRCRIIDGQQTRAVHINGFTMGLLPALGYTHVNPLGHFSMPMYECKKWTLENIAFYQQSWIPNAYTTVSVLSLRGRSYLDVSIETDAHLKISGVMKDDEFFQSITTWPDLTGIYLKKNGDYYFDTPTYIRHFAQREEKILESWNNFRNLCGGIEPFPLHVVQAAVYREFQIHGAYWKGMLSLDNFITQYLQKELGLTGIDFTDTLSILLSCAKIMKKAGNGRWKLR
jgi:hypothetical protein